MKSVWGVLAMFFSVVLSVQADDEFNLDEVTIELVEEGDDIAHQIEIPFLASPPKAEANAKPISAGLANKNQKTKTQQQAPALKGNDALKPPNTLQKRETINTVNLDNDASDFLDLIQDETEGYEELTEREQEDALALADELLDIAEEEIAELEQEVDHQNFGVGEEQREQAALIEALKGFKEEDDDGVIIVYERLDMERQESQVEEMNIKEEAVDAHPDQ